MINPSRIHRAKAIVTRVFYNTYEVTLANGSVIKGWDLPRGISLGDSVNVQCQYSICLDCYTVVTINNNKSRSSIKRVWSFRWDTGGYNTVYASNRKDALKLAHELGMPSEYSPGKMTKGLKVRVDTLSDDPAKLKVLDDMFRGMCD